VFAGSVRIDRMHMQGDDNFFHDFLNRLSGAVL